MINWPLWLPNDQMIKCLDEKLRFTRKTETHRRRRRKMDKNLRLKIFFIKMGQTLPLFVLFSSFSQHNDIQSANFDYKCKKYRWCAWDLNPRDHRMLGADESTELWRPPAIININSRRYTMMKGYKKSRQESCPSDYERRLWVRILAADTK